MAAAPNVRFHNLGSPLSVNTSSSSSAFSSRNQTPSTPRSRARSNAATPHHHHSKHVSPATNFFIKFADNLILTVAEYTKTFLREILLLIGQIINTFIIIILHIVTGQGHYTTSMLFFPKVSLNELDDQKSPVPSSSTLPRPNSSTTPSNFATPKQVIQNKKSSNYFSDIVKQELSKTVSSSRQEQLSEVTEEIPMDASMVDSEKEWLLNQQLEQQWDQYPFVENDLRSHETMDQDYLNDDRLDSSSVTLFQRFFSMITYAISKMILILQFGFSGAIRILYLIVRIPRAFRRKYMKNPSSTGIQNDKVKRKEKETTGLFEDFLLALFEFVDRTAIIAQQIIRLECNDAWHCFKHACLLFVPNHFINTKGFDKKTIKNLITDEGYPYEKVSVITKDGYVLRMDRIPNPKSRNVIYFQHGIIDCSFAWVGQGCDQSLAFRAFDSGCDVFLGNFRGYGPSLKHRDSNIGRRYWDFSFNEYAFYDVRAFVDKIVKIKRQELNCPKFETEAEYLKWDKENIFITAVAHSLGGASILAYLVHQRVHKRPHHLSNAVLMAPAGNHKQLPALLYFGAKIVLPILKRLPLYYVGFTSKTSKLVMAKLVQDINNHPALRSLFSSFFNLTILGGKLQQSPLQRIHNLFYHTFNGTSLKVLEHLIQMQKNQQFEAYDYGDVGNMAAYDQKKPLNFLENYHLVNIPITFIYGSDDRIIPAENVLKHVITLQRFHRNNLKVFAKRFESVGHIDLIFATDEALIQYVMKLIQFYFTKFAQKNNYKL